MRYLEFRRTVHTCLTNIHQVHTLINSTGLQCHKKEREVTVILFGFSIHFLQSIALRTSLYSGSAT